MPDKPEAEHLEKAGMHASTHCQKHSWQAGKGSTLSSALHLHISYVVSIPGKSAKLTRYRKRKVEDNQLKPTYRIRSSCVYQGSLAPSHRGALKSAYGRPPGFATLSCTS